MSGSEKCAAYQPLQAVDALIDQERAVRFLSATLQGKALPPAFLFTGIDGVGKQAAAAAVSMASNCSGASADRMGPDGKDSAGSAAAGDKAFICGECRSCRKILSGQHPDIIHLKPAGATLKIDQVREVCRRLGIKPHEARIRVVIICHAEKMNTEAGNALLKILEEPPERTILILIAQQPSDLLPTIVSRCRHVRFNPVSVGSLSAFLTAKYHLEPHRALILAEMANGSLRRAVHMQETDWFRWREWILNIVTSPDRGSVGSLLAFSERLVKAKERLADALDIYQSWFRDLIVYPYAPEKIINKDMLEKIADPGMRLGRTVLIDQHDAIRAARRRIETNANLRLVIDTLLLKLTGL